MLAGGTGSLQPVLANAKTALTAAQARLQAAELAQKEQLQGFTRRQKRLQDLLDVQPAQPVNEQSEPTASPHQQAPTLDPIVLTTAMKHMINQITVEFGVTGSEPQMQAVNAFSQRLLNAAEQEHQSVHSVPSTFTTSATAYQNSVGGSFTTQEPPSAVQEEAMSGDEMSEDQWATSFDWNANGIGEWGEPANAETVPTPVDADLLW